MQRAKAVIILVLLVSPASLAKRNDDVVIMKNGDRFTGEIKRLEDGKLVFSASYMLSDVSLDWTKVERIESKDQFNVYLTNGGVHTGVMAMNELAEGAGPTFSVTAGGADVRVDRNDVVVVRPIEDSFWKQLTGSFNYGYSFTGGRDSTTQSSLSGSITYRVERWSMQLNGSSVLNTQSEGNSTGRNTLSYLYTRQLTDRWYAGVLSELLNSRQQDLTLRSTVGGGLGRALFRSERTALGLLSGLLFSRERYSSEAGTQPQANNVEALFHLKYQMYRFKKVDVDAVVYSYTSLTDQGRVRMGGQPQLGIQQFRN
jgi:hypothetical protein